MPPPRLVDHARLTSETLADVGREIESHATLERVLDWTRAAVPPHEVAEIVTQDEYTHDVVVRYRHGLYLVYDTT